jgi:hypothetical protein
MAKNKFVQRVVALSRMDPVEIPGLDMKVFVRQLSAAAFKSITESCVKEGMSMETDGAAAFDDEMLGKMVTCACLVDEAGDRLIPDGEEGDLFDLPNAIVRQLQIASMKCNGMDTSSVEGDEGN